MKVFRMIGRLSLLTACIAFSYCGKKSPQPGVNPPPPIEPEPVKTELVFYQTKPDQSELLKRQNISLYFTTSGGQGPTIEVDESSTFQTMEGFGYTLTGGSASLIRAMEPLKRAALLKELFLSDSTHIGVSYLRISVGASDLSAVPFTYNDLASGQTDTELKFFSLDREQTELIPVLKEILQLNPQLRIMASPWTAPVWMKTNNAFIGGKLKPEYYRTYANYLAKYIQAMKAEGIQIDALTPQNEPLHDGNNPSMLMLASEQTDFIKNHLGPVFRDSGIKTKIIIYDHNADKPDYPISILNDPAAKAFIHGSAFHLYGGDISALSTVHNAHPDRGIYFTEQWVGGPSNFGGDLNWHMTNLIVGASRNWSRVVLEWNLAADPNYRPHTNGGCTNCLGAITIKDGSTVSRNVAYYIIAHASKFVSPGSVRISSNNIASLQNVAFRTPQGKKVLIVQNTAGNSQTFNIKFNGKQANVSLEAGAAGTFIW